MPYHCPYCKHKPFATERALSQHQRKNPACLARLRVTFGSDLGYQTAHEFLQCKAANGGVDKPQKACFVAQDGQMLQKLRAMSPITSAGIETTFPLFDGYATAQEYYSDDELPVFNANDEEDSGYGSNEESSIGDEDSVGLLEPIIVVDKSLLANFKEYCQKANKFVPFPAEKRHAIELMATLRETKASLSTYEVIMEWHLKAVGKIHQHQSIGSSKHFISRKKVFHQLRQRYNRHEFYHNVTRMTLPSTKATVNIVWTEAKMVIQSLLTNPKIKGKDYLFFGNDPFAPPPPNLNYIEDLNTGRAYIHTYNKLITKPGKQVLLPTPLYIDGTATGQFVDLPITAVKISLGIFNRMARD